MGGPGSSEWPTWVRDIFPLDFVAGYHSFTLIAGFVLILAAIYLWARKRRAWRLAFILSLASILLHLVREWDLAGAASSAVLAGILWATRSHFDVGAGRPRYEIAALRAAIAFSVAGIYGALGFWLLEPGEFHRNFHWWEAASRALRLMLFLGDQTLVPVTPYAQWFLHSLWLISAAAFIYMGFVFFAPVAYQLKVDLRESDIAEQIAKRHGRTAQDYFKHWPDKSCYFSPSGKSFLGYRVAAGYALVLGDPVGPEDDLRQTITSFIRFCRNHGWRVGFYQVSDQCLPVYGQLGFRKLKIGDDAIVDVVGFSLSGSSMKEFRNTVNRLDRLGYTVHRFDPPVDDALIERLRLISDRWLAIPGHRERQFTLGRFEHWYVQSTPIYVALDPDQQPAAFLNLVPSYDPELATVDLMRRDPQQVNGVMDFLFAKVFLDLQNRGVRRFSLGMAPLDGTGGPAAIEWMDRFVHWLIRRAPFLFRADSLRRFKAKFAREWIPRYAIYQNQFDLPRLAIALRRISELPGRARGAA